MKGSWKNFLCVSVCDVNKIGIECVRKTNTTEKWEIVHHNLFDSKVTVHLFRPQKFRNDEITCDLPHETHELEMRIVKKSKKDEEINQRGKGGDIDEVFLSFLVGWELAVAPVEDVPQSNW